MKKWNLSFGIYLVLILVLGFVACSDVVEDITTQDVTVRKTVMKNEPVNGDKLEIIICQQAELAGPGAAKLSKPMIDNAYEVPINIPDIALFLAILQSTEQTNFTCKLTNRADNDVIFSIYFSEEVGIIEPWNSGDVTFIASVLLPANTVQMEISDVSAFQESPQTILNAMINFVGTLVLQGKNQIIVYLAARTPGLSDDEEIDVLVEDLTLILPAFNQIKDIIVPGDLSNYADKIQEVTNSKMVGSITNSQDDTVFFSHFLSVVDNDFVTGCPGEADSIAVGFVGPHSSVAFRDAPQFFVQGATAKLNHGIEVLGNQGLNLESNLFFWSNTIIQATIDSLEIESDVEVSL